MKKLKKLLFALVIGVASVLSPVYAKTPDSDIPKELVEVMKQQIYESYPEKFPERNISNLSLEQMEARASVYTEAVQDGATRSQNGCFLDLLTTPVMVAEGENTMEITVFKSYNVTGGVLAGWNLSNANVSYSKSSGIEVTATVKARGGYKNAAALFADIRTEEWTVYTYDQYSGNLLTQHKQTLTKINDYYIDSVYVGQVVFKFYGKRYIVTS